MSKMSADCFDEIFEYLEEDRITLYSCLLVNRLWCRISVRILWKNIWRFKSSIAQSRQSRVEKAIFNILIACLPNESKNVLHNLINVEILQEAKPPLFNYVAFCKVLSIHEIVEIVDNVLNHRKGLVINEIIMMFMNQISSLKKLIYYQENTRDIPLANFRNNLVADLSELCCSLNIHSEFFYQLSQICYNLQSLSIVSKSKNFNGCNGLKKLISSQNNLKNLNLFAHDGEYSGDWTKIIPAITGTLSRLHIYDYNECGPGGFKKLQNITFPKLKILKISYSLKPSECMMKFLENNGKYLKEFHINENIDSLGLSIAKFCPNLRKLSLKLNKNELDILKIIFDSCQYLESIKVWCGNAYLKEKELLEVIVKYSPKNFCELKICFLYSLQESFLKELRSFFIKWKDRASKKSITIITFKDQAFLSINLQTIEKYKKLGIISKDLYEEEEEGNDHFEIYNYIRNI